MFITNDAHRSALLGLFAGKGDAYWRVVEKVFFKPWYLVTLKQEATDKNESLDSEDGFEFTRSIFISELSDLLSLLELASSATYLQTLESVMIVTPGHMNGSGEWQMDRLAAIWRAANVFSGDEVVPDAVVLETAMGSHYPSSSLEDIRGTRNDLTLVYRLPTARS